MKATLSLLITGHSLTREQAAEALEQVLDVHCAEIHRASFLTATAVRIPTLEELLGYRDVLKARSHQIENQGRRLVDLCGTGGDGKDTFNISTLTAFVVAAMGIPVVKHGNYSASSRIGSSNLLETLGITFPLNQSEVDRRLNQAGIAFLHAPIWHPALKELKAVRTELGFRTIFNLLGPLLNPCPLSTQVIGVPNTALQKLFAQVMPTVTKQFAILTSDEGHDEVILSTNTLISGSDGVYEIGAKDFALTPPLETALRSAASAAEAAAQAEQLLRGRGDVEKLQVLAANAAVLAKLEKGGTLKDNFSAAMHVLSEGEPYRRLERSRER